MHSIPRLASLLVASACLAGCDGAPVPVDTAAAPKTTAPTEPAAPRQAPLQSAAPDLLARRELPLLGRPAGLLAHDFNQDGYGDLAVVTESPGRLEVFLGSATGLAERAWFESCLDFPTQPVLSGDHLVLASMSGESLVRFPLNADWNTNVAMQTVALQAGVPRLVTAAGRSILWVSRDDELVLIQDGNASLRRQLPAGTRVVDALLHPSGAIVLLCQGTQEILSLPSIEAPDADVRHIQFDGVPRSIAAGDVDGDGDEEAVVVGADRAVWVFGLGAPGWMQGDAARLTQPNLVPKGVRVRDLNGDGRAEIVSLGLIDQDYCVLTNPRPEGAQVIASEYAGQDRIALAMGDFDGDGKLDLATACRAANAISLWAGTGRAEPERAPFSEARRLGVGGNPLSIASADLLGPRTADGFGPLDGRPEIATLDAGDGMVSVLANDGYGTLSLAARWPVGPSPRGLRTILGPGGPAVIAMSVAPGRGGALVGFRDAPIAVDVEFEIPGGQLPAADEAQILAADLDRDGATYLILAATGKPEIWVLRNISQAQGGLRFRAASPRPWSADAIAAIQRGEYTYLALGRGHEVRLVTLAGDDKLRVAALGAPAQGRGVGRLAATDWDGDGRDELAVLWLGPNGTSPGTLQVRTLMDLEGSTFIASFDMPTGFAPQGLTSADLNADGVDELLVAAQNSHLVNMWQKAPGGAYRALPDLGAGLGPMAVSVADLIGKAVPDIVVANAFSADVSVVYNRPRPAR